VKRFSAFFVSALLPLAVLVGCGKSGQPDADDTKAAPTTPGFSSQTDSNGNAVVSLNAETQKRIGLETSGVVETNLPAQMAAYGTILDPTPLVALHGELAADEASSEAAGKIAQREKALFAADQTTSKKNVEAAETDESSARIKLESARESLRLNWGDAVANLAGGDREKLIGDLVARRVALARVDLPIGELVTNLPTEATISPVGAEHWAAAKPLSFAASIDPRTLGQGIILRVEHPDPLLAPGGPVRAYFPASGAAARGGLLPEGVIVRFNGAAWVYTSDGGTNFTRREVYLDRLTPQGWLATNAPAAGEKIVTVGAATLLSEEQKASAPSAD